MATNVLGNPPEAAIAPQFHPISAKAAPPEPPKLLDVVVQNDAATYRIAHKAATLVPSSQPALKKPYNSSTVSSVLVSIDDGRTAPKTINVHAEDVYIYSGTIFNFKEKTITISANRIFCVPSTPPPLPPAVTPAVTPAVPPSVPPSVPLVPVVKLAPAIREDTVTIDISGRDSVIRRWPEAKDGLPGIDFALGWRSDPAGWIIERPKTFVVPPAGTPWGVPGTPGTEGVRGNDGRPGGHLTLKTNQLVSLLPSPQPASVAASGSSVPSNTGTGARCALFIDNSGGAGSIGQEGGSGGTGGMLHLPDFFNGGAIEILDRAPQDPPNDSATFVGAGGAAGQGGDAGKWGSLGTTDVFIPSASTALAPSGFTLRNPAGLILRHVSGGPPGAPGHRGKITGLEHYSIADGAPSMGTWPPEGATAAPGADAIEPAGRGRFNSITKAQAGQSVDLQFLTTVVARLKGDKKTILDKHAGRGAATAKAEFNSSVKWVSEDLQFLKGSGRKLTKDESKTFGGLEKDVKGLKI